MYCSNCGAFNSDSEKKCVQCHRPLSVGEGAAQQRTDWKAGFSQQPPPNQPSYGQVPPNQQPPHEQQGQWPPYGQPPYDPQEHQNGQWPPYGQQSYGPQDQPHGQWPPYGQPYYGPPPGYRDISRIAAALLAIFLGCLGIHKFYIGNRSMGIVYLCISVGGPLLAILFFWLIIPVFLIYAPFVMGVIGFVEGIVYLCTDDYSFQQKYCVPKQY